MAFTTICPFDMISKYSMFHGDDFWNDFILATFEFLQDDDNNNNDDDDAMIIIVPTFSLEQTS
jgi:hypothetical protein